MLTLKATAVRHGVRYATGNDMWYREGIGGAGVGTVTIEEVRHESDCLSQ